MLHQAKLPQQQQSPAPPAKPLLNPNARKFSSREYSMMQKQVTTAVLVRIEVLDRQRQAPSFSPSSWSATTIRPAEVLP